ncbi:hypothetical protein DID88_007394 [Monilinia fructigena]|uniref:Uncharacterized protein n=1 Tax=Monilinia fructigena TaxID=38457 RepID=A0A395J8X3_9HELO|nr:hypothetical protein DID88_007394 [Monilinia fructigena]
MPTDEPPPMITAPVSPHDLNRALKRDSNTCNNDICYSPATCFGPVGNIAVCCEPGESCSLITTCYPYTEIQSSSSLGLSSNTSMDAGGSYCSIPEYPYCNTYVFDAYSGLEVIYCDDTSTANNQVILTGTYNWTDGLTVTSQIPAPLTATEYKNCRVVRQRTPITNDWAPAAIAREKPPSYGYEAKRIGMQPDCQAEGLGEGVHAPPAWAPPGDVIGEQTEPAFISELGGESRDESGIVGKVIMNFDVL